MASEPVIIASQLPSAIHDEVARQVPEVRLIAVPAGIPEHLPREATAFFAAPYRGGNSDAQETREAAWIGHIDWIQLCSAGVDGYPPWYFNAPLVTSARGPAAKPVAEFVLAATFAHAKRIPDIWIRDRADWASRPLASVQGSVMGIVGYGAVGQAVAVLAQAVGMTVVAARNRSAGPEMAGVRFASLDEVVAASDHLAIAAAATPATHHLIGRDVLRRAKRGAHLINVARGSLVDQDALREALDDGRLAFATLDVADPEPLPVGHWIYAHPRIRLSPHLSAHIPQLYPELASAFAANLRRYLEGAPLNNVVDNILGY
jgi:phosphoglycerate dehydrogenase-like enzyme